MVEDKIEAQRRGGCHIPEVTQQGNGQAIHSFIHPKYIDWTSFICKDKRLQKHGIVSAVFPKVGSEEPRSWELPRDMSSAQTSSGN